MAVDDDEELELRGGNAKRIERPRQRPFDMRRRRPEGEDGVGRALRSGCRWALACDL
jgi:hypothetical protein